MIYQYVRENAAYDAVQGLSILFSTSCRMTTCKISTLDGIVHHQQKLDAFRLHKSKLKNSVQLQTVMALFDQETARTKEPNYLKLKTAVKLHVDQMMKTRNFRV